MTLDEYERAGKQLYEELAKLVATLLSEEIAKRGEIKLQHVQYRPIGSGTVPGTISQACRGGRWRVAFPYCVGLTASGF